MSVITLNEVELDRLLILTQVKDGFLTQSDAGERLGLSERQVRRLLNRLHSEGSLGLKPRSKGGHRSFESSFKERVLNTVRERYHDFGPTFAAEKLALCDGLKINKETLRQWMMEAGFWKGRARKQARIHQSRERRSRFGELIQIDGSHHDWFEGRGPKCCLLVLIDDATSRILGLRFNPSETTLGYMDLMQEHVLTHGRPLAYYSDKHSIFKTTREDCVDGRFQETQLHRGLKALQIELICAHSSQAKGRVERANKTLQDRLIKEMRLHGISNIQDANAFVSQFLEGYNKRFAFPAKHPEDAHRKLLQAPEELKRILSCHTNRKLSKNLEFSLNRKIYQITIPGKGYRLRGKTITICEHTDGREEVLSGLTNLPFKVLSTISKAPHMADTKDLNPLMDQIIRIAQAPCITQQLHNPCPA